MPSPSSTLRALALLGAAALASACGEPECPHGYLKIKQACFRIDAGDKNLTSEEAGAAIEDEAGEPGPSLDATTQSGQSTDAGTSATATNDAAPAPPHVDSGAPPPVPECDATRPCAPGLVCSAMMCVSACTQTQCDTNATCSLVNNAPTCACNRGFIAMTGAGGAITCLPDIACEELGCDTNASCVVGSDQLRSCVCKNGYTGNGKTCTPVSCDAPSIENGTVSATGGNTFGSTATYRCNTGYQQATGGSWTRMCGANMQWSGTQPRCMAITCPSLSNPLNGSVFTPQGRELGDMATYTCNPRYALSGGSTRTCQASGWSGSEPTCTTTCKNRALDSGERCDPTASPHNVWTCNDTCDETTTVYTACTSSSNCGGAPCYSGTCGATCSASNPSCPAAPADTGMSPFCIAAVGACAVADCTTNANCAPGLICKFLSAINRNVCTGCTVDADCPSRVCNLYSMSPNIGHCR